MNIYVDYEGLTYASDYISKLRNTAIALNANLLESRGCASDSEKAIIELLSEICTVSFPSMLDSTRELIQTIIAGFKEADESFSSGAVSGGLGAAAGIVSDAAQAAIGAITGVTASVITNSAAGALAGAVAAGLTGSATGGNEGN